MPPHPTPSHDGLWVLTGLGALVFVSPLRLLWSSAEAPWYALFIVWALLIAATALVVTWGARGGEG